MEELDLGSSNQKKIKIKRDGVEYFIRKPKVFEVKAIEEKIRELKKDGGSSGTDEMVSFLVTLGLPEEVVLDLEAEEATKIIELASGVKKK